MIYMLDTNILIYLMKNKPESVRQTINHLPAHHQLCMSFVSYAELLQGAYGSQNAVKSKQNLDNLCQMVPVWASHQDMPHYYAHWVNILKKQGNLIGNNDLWIAAHALAIGATLVTHNVKEFQRIDDLKWVDWVNVDIAQNSQPQKTSNN